MSREKTIPSLDGIRALAVLLVFFAHTGKEGLVPGGLGVTVFFVLSGYLITTLMRIEHARLGRIGFRNFYLRRLLRLMPPLVLVVIASGLLSALSLIDGAFTVNGLLAALFYFGNYFVIANDYQGMPAGIGVIWSLAIEEHFYLLFPPLAALLLRIDRIPVSAIVLGTLCALVLAWRYWLATHGASYAYISMATDTRADSILAGCLMALVCNPWLDRPARPAGNGHLWVAAACVMALVGTLVYRDELFRTTLRYTLQSLAIAGLVHVAVSGARLRAFRWLDARPLVYLGSISYTFYLTHHMILLGISRHWPDLEWIWLTLVGAAITVAVSGLMRRWVEQPCARLRQRLHGAARSHRERGSAAMGELP